MSIFRRLTNLSSPLSSSSVVASPNASEVEGDQNASGSPENDIVNAFKAHCRSIQDVLLTTETSKCSPEDCRRVLDNFNVVINIISDEKCGRAGQLGSCLEYTLECGIFQEILAWSLSQRTHMKELVKEQLKLYKILLKRCKQPILIFEEIVLPLKQLLRSCMGKQTNDIELALVEVLHQLCICVNQDVSLLDTHFINTSSGTDASFSVFSLIIPYVHSEGEVGSKSRDAVLLCTSLSMFQEHLANFICEETTFCPVRNDIKTPLINGNVANICLIF